MEQDINAHPLNMTVADMLEVVREARNRIFGNGANGEAAEKLAERLRSLAKILEANATKIHDEKSCIRIAAFDEAGHNLGYGSRTSSDPRRDMDNMFGFLTFRDAFEKRGVPVRHKLGPLWVTSDVPPELQNPAFVAPPIHAAVKLAIDLAESAGKVLRVYSKSNPFEHRMGGHYMVYELRDNLATARIKAQEPCVIVAKSNFDSEVFQEYYYDEVRTKNAEGKECVGYGIYSRDEAEQLVRKLNADPKRDNRVYYKAEPQDYKLWVWEP